MVQPVWLWTFLKDGSPEETLFYAVCNDRQINLYMQLQRDQACSAPDIDSHCVFWQSGLIWSPPLKRLIFTREDDTRWRLMEDMRITCRSRAADRSRLLTDVQCYNPEKNTSPTLAHINVNGCWVVVGGAVGANWLPRFCQSAPGTVTATHVAYRPQYVIAVWMNNGFDVERFRHLEKRYNKSKE